MGDLLLSSNFLYYFSRFTDPSKQLWCVGNELIQNFHEPTVETFSDFELETLQIVYRYLYPNLDQRDVVYPHSFQKLKDIIVIEDRYSSKLSRNASSSYIAAFWPTSGGHAASFDEIRFCPRLGTINYFIKHSLLIEGKSYEHWFAHCNWFYPVQHEIRHKFCKPLEIWNRSLFEQFGPSSFILVFRILSKFVDAPYQFWSKDLMVVVLRTKNSLLWNQRLHTMTKVLRDL